MTTEYEQKWPVLNFIHALVHDPALARALGRGDEDERKQIFDRYKVPPAHRGLFIPSEMRPIKREDLKKIFEVATAEAVDEEPINVW